MNRTFTLEYWQDGVWVVGRFKGIPGVFSQGKSLDDLVENIKDAYQMMMADDAGKPVGITTQELEVELAV